MTWTASRAGRYSGQGLHSGEALRDPCNQHAALIFVLAMTQQTSRETHEDEQICHTLPQHPTLNFASAAGMPCLGTVGTESSRAG